jgi:FtsP/CotA-like multicopper oxidase with cupredoxin domain
MRTTVSIAVLLALTLSHRTTAATFTRAQTGGPSPCSAARPGDGDLDLYCIELLPAAGVNLAPGVARLRPPASPFGLAVTAAGAVLYDVDIELPERPDFRLVPGATALVAWAATPQFDSEMKLGEVGAGVTRLGRIPFDRFLILVTAEPSASVPDRTGRVLLRGASAAVRMQPHDMAFVLAGLLEPAKPSDAATAGIVGGRSGDHADHAGHAMPAASDEWLPPPMYPGVLMPSSLMGLRPDVTPYLPAERPDTPEARPRERVRLSSGETLELEAAPVRRTIDGRTVTTLGFNGQYPGPLIDVPEGARVTVRFVNRTDFPTAIHWHGLRLDNRFDGVPHLTQPLVEPGASFEYRLSFPDPGVFWYHPHHREDALQDLGLHSNILVRPAATNFLGAAHRDEVLVLDDELVAESGRRVGYGRESPTHALMGRFGNRLLVNGEPLWRTRAARGEVVRLYFTNVASTRVFNVSFDRAGRSGPSGVRMKVVASDLSRYTREAWVETVTIAPAERYVVDVRFDEPGEVRLVNRVRAIDHVQARFFAETTVLGLVTVSGSPATPDLAGAFGDLRHDEAVAAEAERLLRAHAQRAPDYELQLSLRVGDVPFPLRPLMQFESVYRAPVEWTGTMPEMDWVVTGQRAQWLLKDVATGRANAEIAWRFKKGDLVKIRLVNDRSVLHAMQHPVHIHGQRFLVLASNGVPNAHPVWKDTVLVPTGFVSDILVELTNPGSWMLHCHIAEHIESGMRMVFEVTP